MILYKIYYYKMYVLILPNIFVPIYIYIYIYSINAYKLS